MFDVGQKIICVDDCFPEAVLLYLRNLPKKGSVYTVRDVIPAQGWKGAEMCAVLLVEIVNPPAPHRKQWGECGFAPHRFRELTPEEAEAIEYIKSLQPVPLN